MRHPSTLAPLLLTAVGVGYLLGAGHAGKEASASPVELTETHGTLMTQNAEGTKLVFWVLRDGRPVSATEYVAGACDEPLRVCAHPEAAPQK
jgi:hypothetical protein